MSRESGDIVDEQGVVRWGFDYNLQVWVHDYKIQQCGHPEKSTGCNACKLSTQDIRSVEGHEIRKDR